jgi:hypothetical protein
MQKISAGKFHFEPPFTSFDHLVGSGKQSRRDVEAERLGRSHVDDQIEFSRLFNRDVAWLRPTQNLVNITGGTTE